VSRYRYKDDPEVVVDASQAPCNLTTSSGLEVQEGEWIVVDGDEEHVYDDEDFQETFTPVRALRRRNPRASGKRGMRVAGAMEAMAERLFQDERLIDGYELQDEEGNVIARVEPKKIAFRSPAGSPWRQDLEPTVEDVEIGPDGKPQRMRVKPVEWPPKGEKF
jgi:hypothetical protein